MIVDGFDLDSALVCEGIVGDGCGGGRVFYVKEDKLFAYDPYAKTHRELLKNLLHVESISKKACIITLLCKEGIKELDLSTIKN